MLLDLWPAFQQQPTPAQVIVAVGGGWWQLEHPRAWPRAEPVPPAVRDDRWVRLRLRLILEAVTGYYGGAAEVLEVGERFVTVQWQGERWALPYSIDDRATVVLGVPYELEPAARPLEVLATIPISTLRLVLAAPSRSGTRRRRDAFALMALLESE